MPTTNAFVGVNIIAILILSSIIIYYSLSMTSPYPRIVLEYFQYPYVRLMVYLSVYFLSYSNPIVALLAFIVVMFLHLDYVNLSKPLVKNIPS